MDRRIFLCALMLGTLTTPFVGEAQRATRAYRVGCLLSFPRTRGLPLDALEQGLRDAGYLPGLNLGTELRFPPSWVDPRRDELLGELAAEMAGEGFDVIIAAWNPAIAALRRTGATTPVVMIGAIDLVGNGFVRSTLRPGTNMTGLSSANRAPRSDSGSWRSRAVEPDMSVFMMTVARKVVMTASAPSPALPGSLTHVWANQLRGDFRATGS
jgi:hypothetical protein